MLMTGAAMGSFAAATVWRLRAQGLISGEEEVESESDRSLKKIFAKTKLKNDRSLCLHCRKPIRWYDLVPIFSWLMLRGRCRNCKKSIGVMEFASEVVLALAFLVSFITFDSMVGFTTLTSVVFGLWLVMLVILAIQFMYDARWHLLITTLTISLFVLACVIQAVKIYLGVYEVSHVLVGAAYSLVVMPGLYFALHQFSKGQWVGLGDVFILIPFAIMIADWQQSLLLVFLANLLGSIYMIPAMISKKARRGLRVPFGPFLIIAFFIVVLGGGDIVGWYLKYALLAP